MTSNSKNKLRLTISVLSLSVLWMSFMLLFWDITCSYLLNIQNLFIKEHNSWLGNFLFSIYSVSFCFPLFWYKFCCFPPFPRRSRLRKLDYFFWMQIAYVIIYESLLLLATLYFLLSMVALFGPETIKSLIGNFDLLSFEKLGLQRNVGTYLSQMTDINPVYSILYTLLSFIPTWIAGVFTTLLEFGVFFAKDFPILSFVLVVVHVLHGFIKRRSIIFNIDLRDAEIRPPI